MLCICWINIAIFYEIHGTYIKILICLIKKLRETKKEFTSVHYLVHNKIILLTFLKNNETHLFRIQTLPDVECPVQVEFFCKSELNIHILNYTCIYEGVQWISKLQQTGTWSAAHDRPAACVIAQQYSSATCLTTLAFPQGKISRVFQDVLFHVFFLL